LFVLFAWPMKRMRWVFLAAHLVVVASVLLGHIHYTIDVVGGWLAAIVVFCAVRPR
jgi:membrane-associated phospholipid phosphatase